MPESAPTGFEPLSSANKEIGWANMLTALPRLLEKPRPSKVELPILHRLTTSGIEHPELPKTVRQTAMETMLMYELCDTREQVYGLVPSLRQQGIPCEEGHYRIQSPTGIKEIRYRTAFLRRGHIRQSGVLQVNNGPERPTYSPHTKTFGDDSTYIGLAENLGPVFDDFCDSADRHFAEAETVEEKLKAVVYTQLWGASVIHPFFDGNGRSFGAKLVLDLNRMGLPVRAIPGFPEMSDLNPLIKDNIFAGFGPAFVKMFLAKSGVELVPNEDVIELLETPQLIRAYMRALENAMREGFQQGPNAGEYIGQFIELGAYSLQLALSRDGHLEKSLYDENIEAFLREQRS